MVCVQKHPLQSGIKISGLAKKTKTFDNIVHDELKLSDKTQSLTNAGIFQSFWHHKSDVELIFDVAKKYFTDGYANTPADKTPTL